MAYISQNIVFVQHETPPCCTVSFVSFDRQTLWPSRTQNDPLKNLVWDSTILLSDPVVLPQMRKCTLCALTDLMITAVESKFILSDDEQSEEESKGFSYGLPE